MYSKILRKHEDATESLSLNAHSKLVQEGTPRSKLQYRMRKQSVQHPKNNHNSSSSIMASTETSLIGSIGAVVTSTVSECSLPSEDECFLE